MRNRVYWFTAAVVLLGILPFLNQAFTIDDPNFLALAAHAWPHPLRLYAFFINWNGPLQYAFNILANPPLVPWYLAVAGAVAGGREWVYHLLFLPFTLLAVAGLYRVGKRFSEQPDWTVFLSVTTPVFLVPAHTLMPDIPLLAFFCIGTAIAIEGMDSAQATRATWGGLLAGLAALCRYSGMCVVPLLALYAFLNRSSQRTTVAVLVASVLPIASWSAASWWVYGKVHWLALTGFETGLLTPASLLIKVIYEIAAMGLTVGVGAIIAFLLSRSFTRADVVAFVAGSALALDVSIWFGMKTSASVLLVVGFGGAAWLVWSAVRTLIQLPRWPEKGSRACDDFFLACWVAGILVFHLSLMFASVRYLIAALPPAVLLLQRRIPRLTLRAGAAATLIAFSVSLFVSVADVKLANTYRSYVAQLPPPKAKRWFTGHWGWQYYLEKSGAEAIASNDTMRVGPGDDVLFPRVATPDKLQRAVPIASVTTERIYSSYPFQICSTGAEGCFYSNWVSPDSTPVLLPFGFSREPLEVFTRIQVR